MSAAAALTNPGAATGAGLSARDAFETLLLLGGPTSRLVMLGTGALGLAAGLVGAFAMLRGRSMMSDAISHATLPGVVAGFVIATAFGADGVAAPPLLAGAAAAGVLGALAAHGLARHTRLAEDAAIGVVLSVFFGAGVVGLTWVQKNAEAPASGLDRFILGQAAAMSAGDAALMGAIALAAAVTVAALFRPLTAVCFNDAYAGSIGLPVGATDLALLGLVLAVVVAGLQAVGLVLVIALLVIPAAAARLWTDRIAVLAPLAGGIGAAGAYAGAAASALLPEAGLLAHAPAGSIIVLATGAVFLLSTAVAPKRGLLAAAAASARRRVRIARDHVLEAAVEHEAAEGAGPMPAAVLDRAARARGYGRPTRAAVALSLRLRGHASRRGPNVELTAAGRAKGRRVARNHRLWDAYLTRHADVAPGHVDWSADQVEHVLDPATIATLEADLAGAAGRGGAAP